MIDFSTLQGLEIPEGVVTQIADASGRVLWSTTKNEPAILGVKKITADTYAGETTYTSEEFILFEIYLKTKGTVSVTYGGLTKTITDTSEAEVPNSQLVFFGTFNGVSDSVTTPASGELTIEGDFDAFGIGTYKRLSGSKTNSYYCNCVTSVASFGSIRRIPYAAFSNCTEITSAIIPKGVTSISGMAFSGCTSLSTVELPNTLTDILAWAFNGCTALTSVNIPDSVTTIGNSAFNGCTALTNITLGNSVANIGENAFYECASMELASLPNSITSIGESAFYGCSSMTLSELPVGLTTIAQGAFQACKKISVKSLPSGVTSIGGWGFQGCKLIPSMIIPSGVTSIGKNAFNACSAMTNVTFQNTSGWYVTETDGATSGTNVDVTDTANNVTLLTTTYGSGYFWYRS